MGLAVSVGRLADLKNHDKEGVRWFRAAMKKVNKVLQNEGFPPHVEPENLPPLVNRSALHGFPYSFLHYLRRFATYAQVKPNWKPKRFPKSADPANDELVMDEMLMFSSHLLCHSDCEGFYLPIDFPEPIFADEKLIPGCQLGSSFGLMKELIEVAPFLGITLTDGVLNDSEAARINGIITAEKNNFWIELGVWFSLFEAARLSIEHKTAICFS